MTVDRDLGKLVPLFRERVELLLVRMREHGYDAMVWEAHRSLERAVELEQKGVGIAKSMHCYGVAVDIVATKPPHWLPKPGFWDALGEEAEKLGLVWGGRWRSHKHPFGDRDHVQGVNVYDEDRVRMGGPEQVAALVAKKLNPREKL